MFSIIFDDSAVIDLEEAGQWYRERSPGIEKDFLDHGERTFNFIRNNPLQYQRVGRSLRKAKVAHYPYSIFYYILKDRIIVIACLHNARNTDQILEER